jgi:hypothetical protein
VNDLYSFLSSNVIGFPMVLSTKSALSLSGIVLSVFNACSHLVNKKELEGPRSVVEEDFTLVDSSALHNVERDRKLQVAVVEKERRSTPWMRQ